MARKRIPVTPMLADLVRNGVEAIDGVRFDAYRTCPACGGNCQGYDTRTKIFALLQEGSTTKEISVSIRRFQCKTCGKVVMADAPFYPEVQYGAPIVDFGMALGRIMPYRNASRVLAACHIALDWGTIRAYARIPRNPGPLMPLFGIPVPIALLHLSLIRAPKGEGGAITGTEALAACRPPPADRALLDVSRLLYQGHKRDHKK